MARDMTVGSPIKLILLFSIPMFLGNLFQQFYNMVDAMVVGRFVGVDALAAVGSTGSLLFTIIGFAMGLTTGFSVIISQRFGADDLEGMKRAIAMSILLSLVISVVLTVFGLVFTRPMLQFMNTPPEVMDAAATYLYCVFSGVIGLVFYNLFSSILRAIGDSKTPLYFLILASILNVLLDLLFVLVIPMETAGVGLATILAQGLSAIICLVYIWKKQPDLHLGKHHFKVDGDMLRKLMRVGIPTAFQNSIIGIGVVLQQMVVNGFGATVMAAYTAGCKIQQLSTQPISSLGMAMATYTGQNLGAGKLSRIKTGVHQCLILTVIAAICSTAFCLLFGTGIATFFVDASQTEVIQTAYQYLTVTTPFYIVLGCLFVYRFSLQGLGNAMIPMLSGFLELALRIGFSLVFPQYIGFAGIAWADVAAWVGAFLLLMVFYYKQIKKLERKGLV